MSFVTPFWLEEDDMPTALKAAMASNPDYTHIYLPLRSQLCTDIDQREKFLLSVRSAVDPLLLLTLRRLRALTLQGGGAGDDEKTGTATEFYKEEETVPVASAPASSVQLLAGSSLSACDVVLKTKIKVGFLVLLAGGCCEQST